MAVRFTHIDILTPLCVSCMLGAHYKCEDCSKWVCLPHWELEHKDHKRLVKHVEKKVKKGAMKLRRGIRRRL